MKVAFVSLPVAGPLNPMSALAAEDQSCGVEVVFFSVLDAQARAEAGGLRFVSVGREHLSLGITKTVESQFSETQGEAGLKFTFGLMGTITGAIIRELEGKLVSEHGVAERRFSSRYLGGLFGSHGMNNPLPRIRIVDGFNEG